jgi:hypothetical protein
MDGVIEYAKHWPDSNTTSWKISDQYYSIRGNMTHLQGQRVAFNPRKGNGKTVYVEDDKFTLVEGTNGGFANPGHIGAAAMESVPQEQIQEYEAAFQRQPVTTSEHPAINKDNWILMQTVLKAWIHEGQNTQEISAMAHWVYHELPKKILGN